MPFLKFKILSDVTTLTYITYVIQKGREIDKFFIEICQYISILLQSL